VYPEHTAHYQTARSWWKNCVYKGLRELATRSDEIAAADTSGSWSWVGDE